MSARRVRATRPSMHHSVRIHTHHVLKAPGPNGRRILLTREQVAIADWRYVDWTLALAGAKVDARIIAVGCEEGAMTVHLLEQR